MSSIITVLALFFIVVLGVIMTIALLHIFAKSFNPQRSVTMIATLLAVFIFGIVMFLISTYSLNQEINRGDLFQNQTDFTF